MNARLWIPAILLAATATGHAQVTFDFETGPGPQWHEVNWGNLWTVDLDGPELRISKGEDDLSFNPQNSIFGGIESAFELDGDFTITVDYVHYDMAPDPSGGSTLTESILEVRGTGTCFSIFRIEGGSGPGLGGFDCVAGSSTSQQAPPANLLTSGRYRIQRTGTTIEGFIAPVGTSNWSSLGTGIGTGPVVVRILAAQARGSVNAPERANSPVDIAFDNLVIDGAVPFTPFLRGDANGDGGINVADAVAILGYLFQGEPASCFATLNTNGDDGTDVADVVYVLAWLFGAGAPPATPFPACAGHTTDSLSCDVYSCP